MLIGLLNIPCFICCLASANGVEGSCCPLFNDTATGRPLELLLPHSKDVMYQEHLLPPKCILNYPPSLNRNFPQVLEPNPAPESLQCRLLFSPTTMIPIRQMLRSSGVRIGSLPIIDLLCSSARASSTK